MVEPWSRISSRPLGSHRIFTLREDTRRSPRTGVDHPFVVLEAPDWVNVVALTPSRDVVLVAQYRPGTDSIGLEIPGGMVDADDPDPAAAARRELLEETGYGGDAWHSLGDVCPNPALQGNRCHSFLLLDAAPLQAPAPDGSEDIEVRLLPEGEVGERIRGGAIEHALVICAWAAYLRWRDGESEPGRSSPGRSGDGTPSRRA